MWPQFSQIRRPFSSNRMSRNWPPETQYGHRAGSWCLAKVIISIVDQCCRVRSIHLPDRATYLTGLY